jgi:hypothetical protein
MHLFQALYLLPLHVLTQTLYYKPFVVIWNSLSTLQVSLCNEIIYLNSENDDLLVMSLCGCSALHVD